MDKSYKMMKAAYGKKRSNSEVTGPKVDKVVGIPNQERPIRITLHPTQIHLQKCLLEPNKMREKEKKSNNQWTREASDNWA